MSSEKPCKAFGAAGLALTINGVIFLAITLGMQSWDFFGVAVGCVGVGLPLLFMALFNNKKSFKRLK